METKIRQIKKIDSQIKTICRILKSGEYMAAGLALSINVGQKHEDFEETITDICIGISGEPESILKLIVESLTQSRKFWIDSLNRDIVAGQTFLQNLNK